MNASTIETDHRRTRRRTRRRAGLALALSAAMVLAACGDDRDQPDPRAEPPSSSDFGNQPDTPMPGAAKFHIMRVVDTVAVPGGGQVRGLSIGDDGHFLAHRPSGSGSEVVRFNPTTGESETLRVPNTSSSGSTSAVNRIAYGIEHGHGGEGMDHHRDFGGFIAAAGPLNFYSETSLGPREDGALQVTSGRQLEDLPVVGMCSSPISSKDSISTDLSSSWNDGTDTWNVRTGRVVLTTPDGLVATSLDRGDRGRFDPVSTTGSLPRIPIGDGQVTAAEVDASATGATPPTSAKAAGLEWSAADTAIVFGLGELDCMTQAQVASFDGVGGQEKKSSTLAVVDRNLAAEAAASHDATYGDDDNYQRAEFAERIDMVLTTADRGVTDAFHIEGLADDAQVTAVAVDRFAPVMWVALEGSQELHKVVIDHALPHWRG